MKFWGWVRSKTGWINLDTTFAALISSGIDRAESALRFWVNLGPDFAHVVTQDLGGNCVAQKVPIFTKKKRVLPCTKTRFFIASGETFFMENDAFSNRWLQVVSFWSPFFSSSARTLEPRGGRHRGVGLVTFSRPFWRPIW